MDKTFESGEKMPLTEEGVIRVLDDHEYMAPEAIEMMRKYSDQCHSEANAMIDQDLGSPVLPNHAYILAEIKIATVKLLSNHPEYHQDGIGDFLGLENNAKSDPSTTDLAKDIDRILSENGY